MLKRSFFFLIISSIFILSVHPAAAQEPTGPIYIVQAGDTLSSIAARFNVSVDDLIKANNITNPNALSEGQQLVIPGMPGITGILQTELVNFGDSFRSLVRRTQVPIELLIKMNHLLSPTQFYLGASMIIPVQESTTNLNSSMSLKSGESLLELAVIKKSDPWTISTLNGLQGTWDGLPEDILYNIGDGTNQKPSGLPSAFVSAEITTLPIKQGGTTEIIVKPANGVTLSGVLVDKPLHFFPLGDGRLVALQGVYALLDPGVYPLRIDANLPDNTKQSYEQMVLVVSGNYPKESLSVPSEYIDPAVTGPEDNQVLSIVTPYTPNKLWQDKFQIPVGLPSCLKDWFGIRRSFNGSDYNYFHSGLDYGICSQDHPFDIYAAANGTVIFAGPLTIRGNATIIDHGWGIYSGYYHQEEIYVSAGQQVQAGELIGKIGKTGRVTGPHLHFEVWANSVQVDPADWLQQSFP